MNSLFRDAAIDYRRRRLEGDVTLTRSIPLSVITALLTVITVVIASWVILGQYSRTEAVTGSISPAGVLAKVYADKPGQIVWFGVKDGDVVRKGQPIATISTEQDLEGGASPDEQLLSSVGQQVNLLSREMNYEDTRALKERDRLNRLIQDLTNERSQMSGQIELQKQAVTSTRSSFDAMTGLMKSGFETRTDYEQRRQAWLSAATQLQYLVQQIAQIDERRSEAESELAKLPSDHASKEADLHSTVANLAQRRIDIEGARSFTITAPISGRVTSTQAAAGRSTDGKRPLLEIIPIGATMEATLYAPSRAIGMARPGQQVRLMYDAFPYQRFGSFSGHIIAVSHSILAPDEVDAPVKLQDPVYEIRVALDSQSVNAFGDALPLQPGMTLAADVILDRRSFLDWLLEPIRAVRARS